MPNALLAKRMCNILAIHSTTAPTAVQEWMVRTMADKEKLVELIVDAMPPCYSDVFATQIADHLIANGVTVQEWIPVKDRLPERGQTVLVCGNRKGIYTAEFRMDGKYPYFHKLNSKTHWCKPTHWMPLPEAPKGE